VIKVGQSQSKVCNEWGRPPRCSLCLPPPSLPRFGNTTFETLNSIGLAGKWGNGREYILLNFPTPLRIKNPLRIKKIEKKMYNQK